MFAIAAVTVCFMLQPEPLCESFAVERSRTYATESACLQAGAADARCLAGRLALFHRIPYGVMWRADIECEDRESQI